MTVDEKLNILRTRFPTLEVMGDYNNKTGKIPVKCSICSYCFDLDIASINKRINACLECYKLSRRSKESYFLDKLNSILPNIEILTPYITVKAPIKARCKVDGYEWDTIPNRLLNGSGCPKCGNKIGLSAHEANNIIRKLGYSIIATSDSIIQKHKYTKFTCIVCRHTWNDKLLNIERRTYGCPNCYNNERLERLRAHHEYVPDINTTSEYCELLKKIGSPLIPSEECRALTYPIIHLCTVHNIQTKCSPLDALEGAKCIDCKRDNTRRIHVKAHAKYVSELAVANPDIEIIGHYLNTHSKILHRCIKCGNEWMADPANLLSGHGCPRCWRSRGELKIVDFLCSYNIKFHEEYKMKGCYYKNMLKFDFFLPVYNIAIEYQGEQHYKPVCFNGDNSLGLREFELSQKRDDIKRKYCISKGIRLLEIPYWEFDNIETILKKELQIAS